MFPPEAATRRLSSSFLTASATTNFATSISSYSLPLHREAGTNATCLAGALNIAQSGF